MIFTSEKTKTGTYNWPDIPAAIAFVLQLLQAEKQKQIAAYKNRSTSQLLVAY